MRKLGSNGSDIDSGDCVIDVKTNSNVLIGLLLINKRKV